MIASRRIGRTGVRQGVATVASTWFVEQIRSHDHNSTRDSPRVRTRRELVRAAHIRNTPKRVSPIGAFSAADSDSASTARVLRGSITPSSQSRALA